MSMLGVVCSISWATVAAPIIANYCKVLHYGGIINSVAYLMCEFMVYMEHLHVVCVLSCSLEARLRISFVKYHFGTFFVASIELINVKCKIKARKNARKRT